MAYYDKPNIPLGIPSKFNPNDFLNPTNDIMTLEAMDKRFLKKISNDETPYTLDINKINSVDINTTSLLSNNITSTNVLSNNIQCLNDCFIGNNLNVDGTIGTTNIISTNIECLNDVVIGGNLTVEGTAIYVNTENVLIEDNIIMLNSNFTTGTPLSNFKSGIEIKRGDEPNYQFLLNESDQSFKIGSVGNLQSVSTRQDNPINNGLSFWNSSQTRFDTNSNLLFSNNSILSTNMNISSNLTSLQISTPTFLANTRLSILAPSTFLSTLNVSGLTTHNGASTFLSTLNVSGLTTHNGATTFLSTLNVSGLTTHNGATTFLSNLNVVGSANLNTLNVNTTASVLGAMTLRSSLNLANPLNVSQYIPQIYISDVNNQGIGLNVRSYQQNNTSTSYLRAGLQVRDYGLNANTWRTFLETDTWNGGGGTPLGPQNIYFHTLDLSQTTSTSLGMVERMRITNKTTATNLTNGTIQIIGGLAVSDDIYCSSLSVLSPSTFLSSLNISGLATLNNGLDISGSTNIFSPTTLLSSLNVSGLATFNNVNLKSLNINNKYSASSLNNVYNYDLNNNLLTITQPYTISNLNSSESFYIDVELIITDGNSIDARYFSNAKFSKTLYLSTATIAIESDMIYKLDSSTVYSPDYFVSIDNANIYIQIKLINQVSPSLSGITLASVNYSISTINTNLFDISYGLATSVMSSSSITPSVINGNNIMNKLSVNTLDVSALTTLNNAIINNATFNSSLNILGKSTMLSTLNISGLATLNNMSVNQPSTFLSTLNISGLTTHNGATTFLSTLNVSGLTVHNGATTFLSTLNISGLTTYNGATTFLSTLNVSGLTTHNGATTFLSTLNISGLTTHNGATTFLSTLNISGLTNLNNTIINNRTTINSSLNVLSNSTILSSLTVSGSSTVNGLFFANNNAYVLAQTFLTSSVSIFGNTTIASPLTVSGMTTLYSTSIVSPSTCLSSLNISGLATVNNLRVNTSTSLLAVSTFLSSLNISGLATLNTMVVNSSANFLNPTTCLSSLNVSGTTYISNGIILNGFPSNSSGTDNVFRYYVEGFFIGSFLTDYFSSNNTFCYYTKIGRCVYWNIRFSYYRSLSPTLDTSQVRINMNSIPFNVKSETRNGVSLGYISGFPTTSQIVATYDGDNSYLVRFYRLTSLGNPIAINFDQIATSGEVQLSGFYFAG